MEKKMPCTGDIGQAIGQSAQYENMLCGLATRVEAAGRTDLIEADSTLSAWFVQHKAEDSARAAMEAADIKRKTLLEGVRRKLNVEELEALGIR